MNKIKITVTEKPRECQIHDTKFRAWRDGTLERLLANGKWRLVVPTVGFNGYCHDVRISGETYRYHRIIYYAFNQRWDIHDSESIIDHIDRNRSNNAISNLRVATKSQNNTNICRSDRKVGHLPNIVVRYNNRDNCWQWFAYAYANNKRFTRAIKGGDGKPPDPLPPVPQKIIDLRNNLVRQHHGEFAVII